MNDKYEIQKCPNCGSTNLVYEKVDVIMYVYPITKLGKVSKRRKIKTLEESQYENISCLDCDETFGVIVDSERRIKIEDK